jgi:predicted MFS family arabinose efflux permease
MCDIAAVIMSVSLIFVAPTTTGMAMAMTYGVVSSMALPLETIMLPLVTADLFGEKDYAKMLGIFVSINTAGYAVGAPLTNLVYDKVGTYVPAFFFVACMMVVIAVAFQISMFMADKKKKQLAQLAEYT